MAQIVFEQLSLFCVFSLQGSMLKKISRLTCFLLLLCLQPSLAGDEKLTNVMQGHGSPYLRLHENDPVAWQEWGPHVIERAKKENKMLFVSIGYFSCHWCHVMQRESFSDGKIAQLMNQHFIPVKVDRELNPGLDAYLIEFVQRTRGAAGWPLNVIITPDGYPVVGVTYLPKDRLSKLLLQMKQLWDENRNFINQMAQEAAGQLRNEKQLVKTPLIKGIDKKYAKSFTQQALEFADDMSGGFGNQSKFPMIPQIDALLIQYKLDPQPVLRAFLELTLNQMATQGLRDHIGGGFYRYTVDPSWQTPHFEKMLYDNASLSLLYSRAATILQREDYRGIARETLNFMARELLTEDGALVSSLSAVDSANVEGGYYLWSEDQLKRLLTDSECQVVYLLWNMDDKPWFEAGFLPHEGRSPENVATKLGKTLDETLKILAEAQFKLFKARQQRTIPVDTKQLASWNGLALQAFVEGSKFDSTDKYRNIAGRIRDYLVKVLWDGKILRRATGGKGHMGEGTLEDYAFAAEGLWRWYLLTHKQQDLDLVKRWVVTGWQRFYDKTGWILNENALLPLDFGSPIIKDAPLPSPSASLIKLSMELVEQQDDPFLQDRIVDALSIGHDRLESDPFSYPSQIDLLVKYLSETKVKNN